MRVAGLTSVDLPLTVTPTTQEPEESHVPYQLLGQEAAISREPRIVQDRLYVPVDEIVQRLGGRVDWDNNAKIATARIGQWVATIRMGDRHVDVSGTPVTLAADPYVEEDVMYVPVTFFHDAFGYTVQADPREKSVSISLPAA
jgi:hypothetical protein